MEIKTADFIKGIKGTDEITMDGLSQVIFLGRSNVGKSSTINALLSRKSLVKSSGTPGKTTEVNFFKINNDFYCVDLPGYGYAKIGQQGREKLRKMILWYLFDAEKVPYVHVLIVDAKTGLSSDDLDLVDLFEQSAQPYIILANKTDKLNQKELHAAKLEIQACVPAHIPLIPFSATDSKKNGKMIEEAWKTISKYVPLVQAA